MKLNESKCLFNQSEITFLGHKITSEGISPDPQKVSAIQDMPDPTNVKELQRFLGTVNYLAKFIPNLSEHTAVLRTLLEKDVIWTFEKIHHEAINKLKQIVMSAPVLKYFDPEGPTKVS